MSAKIIPLPASRLILNEFRQNGGAPPAYFPPASFAKDTFLKVERVFAKKMLTPAIFDKFFKFKIIGFQQKPSIQLGENILMK